MNHLRCSVAEALGVIVGVAVGFAALRGADEWWDRGLFDLTLGCFTVAVLGAVYRTGDRRAFWVGFALFGWGYLSLAGAPAVPPRQIATRALAALHQSRLFAVRTPTVRFALDSDRMRAFGLVADDVMRAMAPTSLMASPAGHRIGLVAARQVAPAAAGPAASDVAQTVEYAPGPGERSATSRQWGEIILKASPEGEILRVKDVARVEMGAALYPRGVETAAHFIQIGHTWLAWLVAWLGGRLVRWLRHVAGQGIRWSLVPAGESAAPLPDGPDSPAPDQGSSAGSRPIRR